MATTNTALKATKALTLAISAEQLGSHDEASTAAYTAGQLAFRAGLECTTLWHGWPELRRVESMLWNYVVDGWYDAKDTESN